MKNNILKYNGIVYPQGTIEKISSLYLDGYSVSKIMETINCKFSTYYVRKVLNFLNIKNKDLLNAKSLKKLYLVTDSQKQVIYGSLLGDGSISKRKNKNSNIGYVFSTSHSNKQYKYIQHQADILNVKAGKYIKGENSWSPKSTYYKINYYNLLFLEQVYNNCILNGIKTVTDEWLNQLTWEGIAYWFFDDGCSFKNKNCKTVMVEFSTLSFSKYEIDKLILFLNKFNIKAHTVKSIHGKGFVIRLNSESVNYFMDNIEKYATEDVYYKIKRCE